MKQFLYCESEEGGMSHDIVIEAVDLKLRGWMSKGCTTEDQLLEHFFATAEVGDYQAHRLGICIRLKDV